MLAAEVMAVFVESEIVGQRNTIERAIHMEEVQSNSYSMTTYSH